MLKFGLDSGSLVALTDKTVLLENEPGVFGVSALSPIVSEGVETGYAVSWVGAGDSAEEEVYAGTVSSRLDLVSSETIISVPSLVASTIVAGSSGTSALVIAMDSSRALQTSSLTIEPGSASLTVEENIPASTVVYDAEAVGELSYQWYRDGVGSRARRASTISDG